MPAALIGVPSRLSIGAVLDYCDGVYSGFSDAHLNVCCGVEPEALAAFSQSHTEPRAAEFDDYMVEIIARYPPAGAIHLVLDNLNAQGRKSLTKRSGEKLGSLLWDRCTVHNTPKHGSWLNQAEIEVSLLSRRCLGRRRIGDLTTLRHEVRAWNRRLNRDGITIEWHSTPKQARRELHYSTTRTRY